MDRIVILVFILMSLCTTCFAVDLDHNNALENDCKSAEKSCLEAMATANPEQQVPILIELAKAYVRDQELEKAFKTYLQALDKVVLVKETTPSEEELALFQKALDIYLTQRETGLREAAVKMRTEFAAAYATHPEYHLLGYILAAAYANLGLFEAFFDTFYSSFIHHPKHFIAQKTLAMLNIKLFEKAHAGQEQDEYRRKIIDHAKRAIELYPQDGSLYLLVITFSLNEEKPQLLADALNKISNHNIVISRHDLALYIQKALDLNQLDLAQKFIDKGKEWYAASRLLKAAQDQVDTLRKQNK